MFLQDDIDPNQSIPDQYNSDIIQYPLYRIMRCMVNGDYEPYTNSEEIQSFNLLFATNITLNLKQKHNRLEPYKSAIYMAFDLLRLKCCEVQLKQVLYAHQTAQYPADTNNIRSVEGTYLFFIREAWISNNYTLWEATINWLSSGLNLKSTVNEIFKDAYLWGCMPSFWGTYDPNNRCNRPSSTDTPDRPSTSNRLHWFDPLYAYLDVDLMPVGDTVFDFDWIATSNPTIFGDSDQYDKQYASITGYYRKSIFFGKQFMFRISEDELKFLTGIRNFDFKCNAFTLYKNFVHVYGQEQDFPHLATVYNFTSDDLR